MKKLCLKCNLEFEGKIKINNKIHNLQNRKYCLSCSPFGLRNTKKLHENKKNEFGFKCKLGLKCKVCNCELIENNHYKKNNMVICKKCYSIYSIEKQRKNKLSYINYKGGKCESCGYNKCQAALVFHHIDSTKKDFTIASKKCMSLNDIIKSELDKCVLLCSNCHAEEHYKGQIIK